MSPLKHNMDDIKEKARSHYDAGYYESGRGGYQADINYYNLLAQYWMKEIFLKNKVDLNASILDWGAGMGQITAMMPNVICYDISPYAIQELKKRGRMVANTDKDLDGKKFDIIISSHSLEHTVSPGEVLSKLRKLIKPDGRLILILPVEPQMRKKSIEPDEHRHLYCWSFQTITNLLYLCEWKPSKQAILYNPFMLKSLCLKIRMPVQPSLALSACLGRLRKSYPSLLTLAEPSI